MLKKAAVWFVCILVAASVITNIVMISNSIKRKNEAVPTVVMTDDEKERRVTAEFLEERLENASELMTEKFYCTSVCSIEEGGIPFITQKGFSMLFDAEVSAGIDISDTSVEISDDTVFMTLPRSGIRSIEIDFDSIEIFDEKKALFNWSEYKDTADAMKYAEEKAAQKALNSGILQKADEQTKTVIKALFEDVLKEEGMKLEIKSEADNT